MALSSSEVVNGIMPVRTVDVASRPSQPTMPDPESAEKCCGFFFYVSGFSDLLSTVPHAGDVVDAGLRNLRPLYSTSKQIIDDALNSLSGATGSGKIVDHWLCAFTGTRRAATLLTPTLYIYVQILYKVGYIWNPETPCLFLHRRGYQWPRGTC